MTINDLKKLESGAMILLFNDNSAIRYNKAKDEFISYRCTDGGDLVELDTKKRIEDAIEDIIDWLNYRR